MCFRTLKTISKITCLAVVSSKKNSFLFLSPEADNESTISSIRGFFNILFVAAASTQLLLCSYGNCSVSQEVKLVSIMFGMCQASPLLQHHPQLLPDGEAPCLRRDVHPRFQVGTSLTTIGLHEYSIL